MSTKTKSQLTDFTLGCDPELSWNDPVTNQSVSASSHISSEENTEFGFDGNGHTVEIRPPPSKNPLKIVSNIRTIFVEKTFAKPNYLDFDWFAGSEKSGKPLGGHVHFGIKNNQFDYSVAAKILSNYLGSTCILIEDKDQGIRRRQGGYGGMNDVRAQSWGMEYRALSSWLVSPYVASGVLCLSKVLMWEMLNNPEFKNNSLNLVTDLDFKNMNTVKFRENFPTVWEQITKMMLYQKYKPFLDFLYFLVKEKLSWFPRCDMKEAWGLVKINGSNIPQLTLDNIWVRYNNTIV